MSAFIIVYYFYFETRGRVWSGCKQEMLPGAKEGAACQWRWALLDLPPLPWEYKSSLSDCNSVAAESP